MSHTSLHILVPGLAASMPGIDQLSPPLAQATLQRFLNRADMDRVPGYDLESTLCQLFGIEQNEHGNFPLAALRRAGTRNIDKRLWLQAEPVCLRPDQRRLLLYDCRDLDVSTDELNALAGLFINHFESEGWLVEADDPYCWYISPDGPTAISSHSLGDVFGRSMDLFLPQGKDRLRWHRLLNEVQMLFFDTEVNRLREAAGKMPVSGLWFSGFGYSPEPVSSQYRRIFGNDSLTAGLAQCTATPLHGIHECNKQLLPTAGASLVVYPEIQRPVWRADTCDWAEKVGEFGRWLELRLDELMHDRQNELWLYPCDGRVFRYNKFSHFRFWRPSRPLSTWLKA
ncbi:MAG: hypothetical protein KDI47_08605 [Gammaproteobacteria bacterium]|nr:hypothetical protein [Gammaproteobacteria bacterium]